MGLVPTPINFDKFIFDIDNLNNYNFSKEEIKYIEEINSIKMCVLPNFMPYSDIKDGKLAGAVSDYMALIEKKIQKPLTLVPTNTWAETKESAKNIKFKIVIYLYDCICSFYNCNM